MSKDISITQAEVKELEPEPLIIPNDDYKRVYLAIEKQIEDDSNDVEYYLGQIFNIMRTIQLQGQKLHKQLTPEHLEYFLSEALPTVVRSLLTRRYDVHTRGVASLLQVNEFLQCVIDFIIPYIDEDVPLTLLDTLRRIFDEERNFYLQASNLTADSDSDEDEESPSPEEQEIFVEMPKRRMEDPYRTHMMTWTNPHLSPLLIKNANFFGRKGGFTKIIQRMKKTESKLAIPKVKLFTRIFFQLKDLFTTSVAETLVPDLQQAIFAVLLTLSDNELRALEKTDFEEITRMLQALLEKSSSFTLKIAELMERFYLDFALKCFKSPLLEKRMHGLAYIEEVLELAENRDRAFFHHMEDYNYYGHPMQIRASKYMISWLQENKIIHELFALNPHIELIKRSKKILIFLAHKQALTEEYIDTIWQATVGKHESIVAATLEVISDSCYAWQDKQLEHLIGKITSLEFGDFTTKLISILADLAKTTSASVKNTSLDLLWHLVLDENSQLVKADIQLFALSKLVKLMDAFWFRSKRAELTAIYLTTIKSGTSVLQSLQLLKQVLESYPERDPYDRDHMMMMNRMSYPQEDTRRTIILKLNDEMHLLDILLNEYLDYKEKTKGAVPQQELDTCHIVPGLYGHLEQVKGRLEFVMYVLLNSDLRLTKPQLEILWTRSVVHALTQAEQENALDWFTKLSQNSSDFQTLLFVFQELLSTLNLTQISITGFKCFTKYFSVINRLTEKLTAQEEVLEVPLQGNELLWKIALESENPTVFAEAVDFIIKLHQKLSKEFKGDRAALVENLTSRIISQLQDAMALQTPLKEKRIDKCVTILKAFLDQSKAPLDIPQHDRGNPVHVNVKNGVQEVASLGNVPSQFMVKVYTNDFISLLRNKVAKALGLPTDQVNLSLPSSVSPAISGVGDITIELSDDRTMKDYNLFDKVDITAKKYTPPVEADHGGVDVPSEDELEKAKQIVEIFSLPETAALVALRRTRFNLEETVNRLVDEQFLATVYEEASKLAPPPPPKKKETAADVVSPCMILLHNDNYFNLLFDLLRIETIDRQRVWDILMKLPTNPRVINDLKSIGSNSNWEKLFDRSSNGTYTLLYTLQVLDSFLQADGDALDKESEKIQWCKDFLYHGGFRHLFQIFTVTQIDAKKISDRAWKSNLVLLLKIISHFIKGDISVLPVQPKNFFRHSGETLKQSLDFTVFLDLMIQMTWNIGKYLVTEAMNPAMSVLVVCLLARPELVRQFYEYPDIDSFIIFVLSEVASPEIRREAADAFYTICSVPNMPADIVHPHSYFLKLLLANIPEATSTTCEQYFDLLNRLIKDSCSGKGGGSSNNFKDLLDLVITRIKERPLVETHRSGPEDGVLIGLLSIVKTLASQDPTFKLHLGQGYAMITEIFDYLFALPTEHDLRSSSGHSRNKCKTHASRTMALSLLAELARDCPSNFNELVKLLKPHHVGIAKDATSYENPKILEKSVSGYVGMKNLGSTCYVNSLMQQFFMIPAFRNQLLSLDIPTDKDTSKVKEDIDHLLYQIQVMFAYLYDSERQHYNPTSFCKAFRDWEGNSINTSLQQDVLEFFNILCDHLEKLLKETPYPKLLDNTFTGTLSQEFISKDCIHYSESTEPFYTISVDIKGKNNLMEALQAYVAGEVLEGESAYLCEQCKKKVRALKRSSIKKMSDTLIIHLKRFEYVIDRQANNKLSDYFAFPMKLNIEPFTKEGIAKAENTTLPEDTRAIDSYEYELVGILVHSGSADSGHYYSFIKERTPDDSRNDKWFRFDDTQVSPFNINTIEEECFGGNQMVPYQVGYHTSYREQIRMKNAYMLFYEKIGAHKNVQATPTIHRLLRKQIKEENFQLLRDRQLFDPEYFHFIFQLLGSMTIPSTVGNTIDETASDVFLDAIQMVTYFVFETLLRVREETNFVDWMVLLKQCYSRHPRACKWLLDHIVTQQRGWFRYMMLDCYDEYVRSHFSDILLTVMRTLSPFEQKMYFEIEIQPAIPGSDKIDPEVLAHSKSSVIKFMEVFISYMEFTRQHWRKFMQYFYTLRDFALIGPQERLYLARKGTVGLLVDYYMGPFSPNLKPGQQRVRIGDNNSPADLKYFMMVMATCIRSHATDGSHKSGKLPPTAFEGNTEYPPLTEAEKRLLFNKEFFSSFLKQGYHIESTRDIVAHWTFEDKERTQWMLEVIMDMICRANWNACDNLFSSLEAIIEVGDSIEAWRVEVALNITDNGLMDIINHYKDRYPKFTQSCIKFVTVAFSRFQAVAGYLYYTRKDWWPWLDIHLKSRIAQQPEPELNVMYQSFIDFLANNLPEKKFDGDYTSTWKPAQDKEANSKFYKLYIQKF